MTTLPLYVPALAKLPKAIKLLDLINQIGIDEAVHRLQLDQDQGKIEVELPAPEKDQEEPPPTSDVPTSSTEEITAPKSKNGLLYDAIIGHCTCYECYNQVVHTSRIPWRILEAGVNDSKLDLQGYDTIARISHPIRGEVILCCPASEALLRSCRQTKTPFVGYIFSKISASDQIRELHNYRNADTMSFASNPSDYKETKMKFDHQYRLKQLEMKTKENIAQFNIDARMNQGSPLDVQVKKDALANYQYRKNKAIYERDEARRRELEASRPRTSTTVSNVSISSSKQGNRRQK